MNDQLKQTLVWMPRILGILFGLFTSLFAFDVFDMGLGFWDTALALFMHLLPALTMLVAVILAWRLRWEWAGAIGFIGFAIWYASFALGQSTEISLILIFAGIPILIGALFLINWVFHKQLVG